MGDEVVDMKGEALLPKAVLGGLLGARQEGHELQVSFLRPVLSLDHFGSFWIPKGPARCYKPVKAP